MAQQPFIVELMAPGKCGWWCEVCLNAQASPWSGTYAVAEKTWECIEKLIRLPEFLERDLCFIWSSLSDFTLSSMTRLAQLPIKSAVILARIQELSSFLDNSYTPLIRSFFPGISALQLSIEQSQKTLPEQIEAMKILIPFMVDVLLNTPNLRIGTVWIGTNDANTETEFEACIQHYKALHIALAEANNEGWMKLVVDWIKERGLTKYNLGGNGTEHGVIHRFSHESEKKDLHIAMSLRKRREQAKDGTDRETIIHQLHEFQTSWGQVTSGGYFSGNLVNIHHSPDTFLSTWRNPSWLSLDEFLTLLDMAKRTNFIQAKIDFLSGKRN